MLPAHPWVLWRTEESNNWHLFAPIHADEIVFLSSALLPQSLASKWHCKRYETASLWHDRFAVIVYYILYLWLCRMCVRRWNVHLYNSCGHFFVCIFFRCVCSFVIFIWFVFACSSSYRSWSCIIHFMPFIMSYNLFSYVNMAWHSSDEQFIQCDCIDNAAAFIYDLSMCANRERAFDASFWCLSICHLIKFQVSKNFFSFFFVARVFCVAFFRFGF